MIRIFSAKSASRVLRAAAIIGVMGLCADISAAAAKVLLSKPSTTPVAASVSSVKPFILALESEQQEPKAEAAREQCREVVVETDEGYGVRGTVTRIVCRKVL